MEKSSKEILKNRKKLLLLYRQKSIYRTASHLKVGLNTVRRWLDKHSIPRHGKIMFTTKGKKKPINLKKDARYRYSNGYIFIKKKEWDKEKQKHRYKIEQSIKRKLTPIETVHHINGLKDDNKIENLYLYKSQKEHKLAEGNLGYIAFKLFRKGIIGFKDGNYYIK